MTKEKKAKNIQVFKEEALIMAVVMDFFVGSTHILIHDDFVRGPEETQRILKKVGRDATRAMVAAGTYPGMKTAPETDPEPGTV